MAVLNIHHHGGRVPPGAVNIMRGTAFGNPYPIVAGKRTREQAVEEYRRLLWFRLQRDADFAEQVRLLHGRDLCCCCAPKLCHGDVLVRAADYLSRHAPS